MKVVKLADDLITEEMVQSLIGKFVHVPLNNHLVDDPMDGQTEVNAWFAGKMVGYEKMVLQFDYSAKKMWPEPVTAYTMLMQDGVGYVLSTTGRVVIHEISEEEYIGLVAEEAAMQLIETQEIQEIINEEDE